MANLNFKWGLHENLVKMTTSEVGAVYFTKDEGGLYLGVDANKAPKRVQGVVQYYEDLTQFKSNVLPPYSSDIIYYIASENALVKWNGNKIAADGTKEAGQFTILNVTASEFTSAIQTLNLTIAEHNNRISQNTTNIEGLRADLGTKDDDKTGTTAFARIKALEKAVDDLEALTGTGGAGNSLTDRIKALEDWKDTAVGQIDALQKDVSNHTKTIGQHGETLNNHEGRIGALETWKGNASNSISDHGTRLAQAEEDIKDINDDISKIVNTDLVAITSDISGLTATTSGLRTDLGTNTKTGTTAFGRIAALEAEDVKINAAADALAKRVKNTEDAVSNHGTRLTTAEGEIDSLQTDVAKNKGDIGNLNSNLTNHYYTKGAVDELHTSLETKLTKNLTDHINAANALVYIGGISSIGEWDNIRDDAASVGNTYVVAASGLNLNINGSTVTCYAGDLLIATGDETDNVIPAGNVEWVHVKAGYNESLASTLRVIDGDTTSVHKKATVQLSSYKGAAAQNYGDLGKFSIVSDSENLEVKVNSENVAISMVWGDF